MSVWPTLKSKISAGVAVAISVAGILILVNQPGHEDGYIISVTGDFVAILAV